MIKIRKTGTRHFIMTSHANFCFPPKDQAELQSVPTYSALFKGDRTKLINAIENYSDINAFPDVFMEKPISTAGILKSFEILESIEIGSATAASKISLSAFLMKVLDILSGLPHALVGGLCLASHAKPRATEDLDFVVASSDVQKITKALEDAGLEFKETLPYQKPARKILKFEFEGREVDFLFFDSNEFNKSLLERASPASIFGKSVNVASKEDLVLTKLASARYKDKGDIMAIRSKQDDLDLDYIRMQLWNLGISDRLDFLKLPVED